MGENLRGGAKKKSMMEAPETARESVLVQGKKIQGRGSHKRTTLHLRKVLGARAGREKGLMVSFRSGREKTASVTANQLSD